MGKINWKKKEKKKLYEPNNCTMKLFWCWPEYQNQIDLSIPEEAAIETFKREGYYQS
jgi:hypothetical protein